MIKSTSDYSVVITSIKSFYFGPILAKTGKPIPKKYFHDPEEIINSKISSLVYLNCPNAGEILDFYIKRLLEGVICVQNKDYLFSLCRKLINNYLLDYAKTILYSGLIKGKRYKKLLLRYRNKKKICNK